MLVGEGPGLSEDVIGEPFVGPAGKVLRQVIKDLVQETGSSPRWLVTNATLCYGGTPTMEEIRACHTNLRDVIFLTRPKQIIALGSSAMNSCNLQVLGEIPVGRVNHPAWVIRHNDYEYAYKKFKNQMRRYWREF